MWQRTHYFNKINGHYIDLTRDQFDVEYLDVEYENNQEIPREYCGKNADTLKRYRLLVRLVDKWLSEHTELQDV